MDPFAGSNTTGQVAEKMGRRWLAFEIEERYLEGSKFRFWTIVNAATEAQERGQLSLL